MKVVFFSDIPADIGVSRYAGAHRLASELRANDIDCKVIDGFCLFEEHELEKIVDRFISSETVALAISSTFLTPQAEEVVYSDAKSISKRKNFHLASILEDLISKCRERSPSIKVVVGGANGLRLSDHIPYDYCIQGQGEVSFVKLVKHLLSNPSKTFNGSFERKKIRLIESNKNFPFNGFNNSKINWQKTDFIQSQEWLPIEVARGCVYRCSFCDFQLNGKSIYDYLKDPEVLKEELIYNYETFGVTNYSISDDLYNDSLHKVERYHKVFTSLPFNISWISFGRLDLFHRYPQMADLLKESGLKHMFFGIETLDAKAGRKVGKGLGEKRIKETLEKLKLKWGNSVHSQGSFIIGLPGESKKSMVNTFNWLMSGNSGLDAFYFEPLWIEYDKKDESPSNMSQSPEKYGYEIDDSTGNWNNGIMDFQEAKKLSNYFIQASRSVSKVGSFEMPPLCSIGYDKETVMSSTTKSIVGRTDYLEKKKKWKDRYLEELLKA
ncbi:MAG: hypothetical protein CME65_11545 [Halobacteriovoraceae bacterium]|nr:hypothetical protein [Halobacteriovoraceae bacterium]|tara:strand:- start:30449 stop:31933 length:1485 start_codon:yes stop_codon:yes gene_type:complete